MAASKDPSPSYKFELPVYLKTNDETVISPGGVLAVCRYLAENISLLNKRLQRIEKLHCVCVSKVELKDGFLVLQFVVEDYNELNEFYELSNNKVLSTTFTKYADENCLQIQASLSSSTKLKCLIEMDVAAYQKALSFFKGIDSENGSKTTGSVTVIEGKSTQHGNGEGLYAENPTKINKTVILALPEFKSDEKVVNVTLTVRDLNISSGEVLLEMEQCAYSLMYARVLIPITSQNDNVTFGFTINTIIKGYIKNKCTSYQSPTYTMTDSDIIRKYLKPTLIPAAQFANHCKHIIIACSETYSLRVCAMQIENVCKAFNTIPRWYGIKVFNSLFAEVDKASNNQLLLSMVLVGNLFKKYLYIANTVLKQDSSLILLSCLKHFKCTDLPKSCQDYIFELTNDLCKGGLTTNYCFLTLMNSVYPFFEEKQISQKLIQTIRDKKPIVPEEVTSDFEISSLNVFENICQRLNRENASLLLEQLLRQLPVKLAIKIYQYLKSRWSKYGSTQTDHWILVHDSVIGSIKSQLSSAKREAENLNYIAKQTEECPVLAAAIQPDFEKAVMQCFINENMKELEVLKRLVFWDTLFTSEGQQIDLIKILAKLMLPDFHYVLFEVLSSTKFKEASHRIVHETLFDCFDNAFSHFSKLGKAEAQRLKDIYSYLSKVYQVPILQSSKNLERHLNDITVDYLKRMHLKSVMQLTPVIEELCEKDHQIGVLFKTHIHMLLNERNINYNEMLLNLCGTNGRLRINSSLTASIVNSIITMCTPKEGTALERFKEITCHLSLWITVMAAEGTDVTRVTQKESFKSIVDCLVQTVKIIQAGDIFYGYLNAITSKIKKEEVITLMHMSETVEKTEIRRSWNDIECCFESGLNKISCICNTLIEITTKMPIEDSSFNIKITIGKLKTLKQKILSGAISARELKNGGIEVDEVEKLYSKCLFLQDYVTSDIFWNSCCANVKLELETKLQKAAFEEQEKEAFESIHRLFGETLADKSKDETDLPNIVLLLEILTEVGITEYRQAWASLLRTEDKGINYILMLLENVTLDKEINQATNVLRQPISNTLSNTLYQLKDLRRYDNTVDAVKKCLHVFGISIDTSKDLHEAMTTFESVKEGSGPCPFATVAKSLDKIDSFSKQIQPETVDVLHALSDSSSLIEFLRKIVDEDIRNLIDAVEDISEQHVQESTVSALIEVKSYLHSLLIKSPGELGAQEFLDTINKQTKALSTNAVNLPAKIDECMSSLHNLISLYGSVANRGEMTAEIIKNTISKGKFEFTLDANGTCDFFVTYKRGLVREKQTKMSLIDLRSRALLLMNARSKSNDRKNRGQDLEKFVSYVDLCIEIGELVEELHQSGDINFKTYSAKKDCCGLDNLQEQLHQEKKEWNRVLISLREEFYLLNFIRGPEIHFLYNCFEKHVDHEKVKALLRYIHPDLKLDLLINIYNDLKGNEKHISNEKMLRYFGRMLHLGYNGNKPIERKFPFISRSLRLTEMVQNKQICVAVLEEHNDQVVKTLLSLFMNTTQTLPEPHQVLFCTNDTTWNDVELLIYRCVGSFKFSNVPQLFCIANIEMLSNELQFKLVEKLSSADTGENFLLSLIFRGSGRHPILDELSSLTYQSSSILSDEQLRQTFHTECPDVVTYTSTVPGLGKSNRIRERALKSRKAVETLNISGHLQRRTVIERLSGLHLQRYHALHIAIGSVDDAADLDTFIFELIILRYVTTRFISYSMQTKTIFIEVANTINDSLRNSLNTVMAFKREHLKWKDYRNFQISLEINSPVQVVCQYLKYLENGLIDRKDLQFSKCSPETAVTPNQCRRLLRKYFGQDGDLSFTVVNIFLSVLADQLKKMACSSFFRISRLSEMTDHKTEPIVRSTLLFFLIESSKEFSSRSVKSCRSIQMSTIGASTFAEDLSPSTNRNKTGQVDLGSQRVSEMVRWEDSNHLVFVFHSQNIQTVSPLYRNLNTVPKHVRSLFESQMKRDLPDLNCLSQTELFVLLQKVARTNPLPLSQKIIQSLNTDYALTPDNLLKMVLIMLRINSHIPVVIMGETGCGKTSLIRYLAAVSDVELEVLSIHAGVEENHILRTISQNNKNASLYPETERWLFLDEINTSEHISIMADAICNRKCLGKILVPNLTVIGACNPYKLRTESAVLTAGLKGKIQTDELSKLVYRVLPLPERLVDYVWDFGTLSDNDEVVYIRRMIDDVFPGDNTMLELLQDLLSASQRFVRNLEAVSYCVSLRDVQRCKLLIKWFLEMIPRKSASYTCDAKIKAIILALAICYHSRFSSNKDRSLYRKELQLVFSMNYRSDMNHDRIQEIIIEEQKDILRRMDLPTGTAKNTALQENVFVILVCLLNKIPIFLVGKPGCSKSLSMQIIRSNLRGKDSKDPFFRSLPQLYCVSFQGSESSTSDGIIKVFEKAIKYQESNNVAEVLSVVILDEIGLAEVSKFNPLKVLHSLLEPDGRQQPDVAVVGISNWALDASKMNRGIHLSRPDMDEEELYQTAISISESFTESLQQEKQNRLETSVTLKAHREKKILDTLKDIAISYYKYVEKLTFKHFHGLRDYYALVKFISRALLNENAASGDDEKNNIIFKGLQRNFGGLPVENATLLDMFQVEAHNEEMEETNVLKLMGENINDQVARHLMCITSGDSILSLVERLLTDIHRDEKVVIFGSHFEEDQTADYNYRILSRIILCMEQGFVLILKDLESIYGSLYDMLNQNYTVIGKKRHCRIALGHYSNPICHVHDSFRCIVLIDEKNVDYSDPPFLNRFEKQYVRFTDTVNRLEAQLIAKLSYWIKHFTQTSGCGFDESDCFPLFSQDMIPSLIIKTCRVPGKNESPENILEICKRELLCAVQPDAVFRLERNESIEMRKDALCIKDEFLKLPLHNGIWHFINEQMKHSLNKDLGLLTIVLTNSSIHSQDFNRLKKNDVQIEKLGAFKSEKQLYLRIQAFWMEAPESKLFLHCGAIEDEKHISLAKSTIENIRADMMRNKKCTNKHVYLIIHLDRRRAKKSVLPINYLSGWEIVTLDSINNPEIPLTELCTKSLQEAVYTKRPFTKYIIEQLFWSFSRIRYQEYGRELNSIQRIIEQIQESDEFLCLLEEHICKWINTEVRGRKDSKWLEDTAFSSYLMTTYASFIVCLEQEVLKVIREPLCKLIYQMENVNVISCYFVRAESHISHRREIIAKMLDDKQYFSVSSTHDETGPECYLCTAADLPLCMPFSKLIFDRVQETKDDFMDCYFQIKEKCDLDEDDEMEPELLEVLFSKHEGIIEQVLSNLSEYKYDSMCEDYFHDFCYLVSITTPSKEMPLGRYQIIRWCLEQEINLQTKSHIELIVKVHGLYWIFSPALSSEYQLFEICSEVFNQEGDFSLLFDPQSFFHFNIRSVFDPNNGQNKYGYPTSKDESISGPTANETKSTNTRFTCEGTFSCGDIPSSFVYTNNEGLGTRMTMQSLKGQSLQIHSGIPKSGPMYYEPNEENLDQVSSWRFDNTPTNSVLGEGKSDDLDIIQNVSLEDVSSEAGSNIKYTDVIEIPSPGEKMHFENIAAVSDTTCQESIASAKDDQNVSTDTCLPQVPAEMHSAAALEKLDHSFEANVNRNDNFLQSGLITNENDTGNAETTETVGEIHFNCNTHETCGTSIPVYIETKEHSLLGQNDSRILLVDFVCKKLLPCKETFARFDSADVWQRRVSSVLMNALKVSSEPNVLHSLRFCHDLISTLAPLTQQIKWETVLALGEILKCSEKSELGSDECFKIVCDLIFADPKLPSRDAKLILGSYLNKCLATDVETKAISFFLHLTKDKRLTDDNFDVFKPPIQLALKLEIDENIDNVIYNLVHVSDLDLGKFPFLHALDETLKEIEGTVDMDSQFAVLIVDIMEDIFNSSLPEILTSDNNYVKEIVLCASKQILENEYGLQFLASISFYKAFTNYFARVLRQNNFSTSDCTVLLQVMKAILDEDSENAILLSMKLVFIRQLGKGMLPWNLYRTCDIFAETFDFLKSYPWKENYLFQCLEGNPMLLYAPKQIQHLEEIFLHKKVETQSEMLLEFFNSISDNSGTVAVFGISLAKFYIARSYKQQDDTFNQLAKVIVQRAKESYMDCFHLRFLECLLGVRTYPGLDLNENSSEIHTVTSIFSSCLFSLILASTKSPVDSNNLSILAKLLLQPINVSSILMTSLRGLCDKGSKKMNKPPAKLSHCTTCPCGYRMFYSSDISRQHRVCPMCTQQVNAYQSQPEALESETGEREKSRCNITQDAEVARIFCHLCVHTCLLGSLSLSFTNTEDMEIITGKPEIDNIPDHLIDIIQKDFCSLQRLMNTNCRDLYIFLQACLLDLKDILCEDNSLITTEEDIIFWTEKIENQISHLVKDRCGSVIAVVKKQNDHLQLLCQGPELSVNENDYIHLCCDDRKLFLPSLFRIQGEAVFDTFVLDLNLRGDEKHHPLPFLLFVIEMLPQLALTEHLVNIVRWHTATVAQIKYRMKRRQCLQMTVEEFIHYDKNDSLRNRMKHRFEKLQESLSVIMDTKICFEILDKRITSQTKMKDCLILDSYSVLYRVITTLVAIQNTFLDTTLQISVENDCKALQFLSKGHSISAIPCINLSEVKSSILVSYHWDDKLLKFSHSDLRYGYGAQMKYEFEAIEKILALKLIAGKSYILLENGLPSVLFVDEFYKGYGKMAAELSKIIPQKPLPLDIIQSIEQKREKHPRLTVELITHVGVLISLAKKTKGEPKMPLKDYVETWKNILTSPLPEELLPASENSIKLCHLIAVYGLLEELNADSFVDSLDDKYRKPLSLDIQNQLSSLLRSNKTIMEFLLKAAKRFTHRCLLSGEADSIQALSDYLADESFWPCDVKALVDIAGGDSKKTLIQYIPEDLKVHHVHATISFIDKKLKDFSQTDVTLSHIATNFASRGGRTKAEQKRKLAQKRFV